DLGQISANDVCEIDLVARVQVRRVEGIADRAIGDADAERAATLGCGGGGRGPRAQRSAESGRRRHGRRPDQELASAEINTRVPAKVVARHWICHGFVPSWRNLLEIWRRPRSVGTVITRRRDVRWRDSVPAPTMVGNPGSDCK